MVKEMGSTEDDRKRQWQGYRKGRCIKGYAMIDNILHYIAFGVHYVVGICITHDAF